MEKGKIIRKENSWWVRTVSSLEGDDVVFTDYPVSFFSREIKLEEGKEVNFEIETEVYTDLGEEKVNWAIIR
jgi:hypothetical protein